MAATEDSVVTTIVNTIQNRIASGEYKAGQRLREVELGKQFNVSRTPIREAFRILESGGLLVSIPRRGVEVAAPLDESEIADCIYMRRLLSREASYMAAQNADNIPAELKENILQIHQELKDLIQEEDFDYNRAGKLDYQLHKAIAQASGSRILVVLLDQTIDMLRPMAAKLQFRRERLISSIAEHDNIIKAIFSGQAENARDYTSVHFYNSSISNRRKAREFNKIFVECMKK